METTAPTENDGFKEIEYLSLISKVCNDLETHLGFGDKAVAEFITDMGRQCETVHEFDAKLKKYGAEMPDYLVRTFHTIIRAILAPKNKAGNGSGKEKGAVERKKAKRNREEEADAERRDHRSRGRDDREPELFKVYKGRVSRLMDRGCFVLLNDFRGKEGLVHVSQISNRRIANAKDLVKRDQRVYVKVLSVSARKMSLSMKDVDQNTGKDLLPLKKSSDDDAFRINPSGER